MSSKIFSRLLAWLLASAMILTTLVPVVFAAEENEVNLASITDENIVRDFRGVINFLTRLSPEQDSGTVEDIAAGNFIFDITWDEYTLKNVSITTTVDGKCQIKMNDSALWTDIVVYEKNDDGYTWTTSVKTDGILSFDAEIGKEYVLVQESKAPLINDFSSIVQFYEFGAGSPRFIGDLNGDAHYGQNNDGTSYVTVPFTGTGIDVLCEADGSGGSFDVYIDDNKVEGSFTTYNSVQVFKKNACSISGLTNENHILKLVKTGGDYVIVDGFSVHQSDMDTRLNTGYFMNDSDSRLNYTYASQNTGRIMGDYNADVHFWMNNNGEINFEFSGTGFDIIGERHASSGSFNVYIDGATDPIVINGYEDNMGKKACKSYGSVAGFEDIVHTAKIEVIASDPEKCLIEFDGILVHGKTMNPPTPIVTIDPNATPFPDGTVIYEEDFESSEIGDVITNKKNGWNWSQTEEKTSIGIGSFGKSGNSLRFSSTDWWGTNNVIIDMKDGAIAKGLSYDEYEKAITQDTILQFDFSMYATSSGNIENSDTEGRQRVEVKDDAGNIFVAFETQVIDKSYPSTMSLNIIALNDNKDANMYYQLESDYENVYNYDNASKNEHTVRVQVDKDKKTFRVEYDGELLTLGNHGMDIPMSTKAKVGADSVPNIVGDIAKLSALNISGNWWGGETLDNIIYKIGDISVQEPTAKPTDEPSQNDKIVQNKSGAINFLTGLSVSEDSGFAENIEVGEFIFDVKWDEYTLKSVNITSKSNAKCKINMNDSALWTDIVVYEKTDNEYIWTTSVKATGVMSFDAESGKEYVLVQESNAPLINDFAPTIQWNEFGGASQRFLGDLNGDAHYGEKNDGTSYVTVPFTGTGIDVLCETDTDGGTFDVYVDDSKIEGEFTAYSDGKIFENNVFSISGLSDSEHTLKLVKTGGTYFIVDGFSVHKSEINTVLNTGYFINDSKLTITGAGQSGDRSTGDFNADIHFWWTEIGKPSEGEINFEFSGTGFDIIGEKHADTGAFEVYIDDAILPIYIDGDEVNYAKRPCQILGSVSGFEDTNHTARIVVDTSNTGKYIVEFDGVLIHGKTMNPPKEPTATATPAPTFTPDPGDDEADFYVSLEGSDENDGKSIASAFKTVQKAQDEVRKINTNMAKDIVVCIMAGTYIQDDIINLGTQDSGSNGYDVVYKAYKNDKVVFSGGVDISDGWEIHDNSLGIYKKTGIDWDFRQLYTEENSSGESIRATRAREPNLTNTVTGGPYFRAGSGKGGNYPMQLSYNAALSFANNGVAEMIWVSSWSQFRARIENVDKSNGNQVTFKAPENEFAWNHHVQGNTPYYLENAIEYLDAEGEWFLDKDTDTLYYKPREGETINSTKIIAPKLETLVNIEGESINSKVENITISGITFLHTNWLAPDEFGYCSVQGGFRYQTVGGGNNGEIRQTARYSAPKSMLQLKYSSNITIEKSEFSNSGSWGIMGYEGTDHTLINYNTFRRNAGGGVTMGMAGDLWDDNEGKNPEYDAMDGQSIYDTITNNTIDEVATDYKDMVAIGAMLPQHMTIAHNYINNMPYTGINLGWNWSDVDHGMTANMVYQNKILNTCMLLQDGGGIYTLGRMNGDSNFYYNYIKNIEMGEWAPHDNLMGIYFDNGSCYKKAQLNVFDNTVYGFQAFNPPNHDNIFEENYYNCPKGLSDTGSSESILNKPFSSNNIPAEVQTIMDASGVGTPDLELPKPKYNLALGKSVTASGQNPEYTVANITDGDVTTRWEQPFIANKPDTSQDPSWVQVDFGDKYEISELIIKFQYGNRSKYKIEYSNDGTTWEEYVNRLSEAPNSSDVVYETKENVEARYIKITMDASGWGSGIYELYAYTPQVMGANSIISPSEGEFSKREDWQNDIKVKVTENGSGLKQIKNGDYVLVEDQDFEKHWGNITLKKEYMATLDANTQNLTFEFDEGPSRTFSLVIIEDDSSVNVALNKPITASSVSSSHPASYLVDGDYTTRWAQEEGNPNIDCVINLDLQGEYNITGTSILFELEDEVYNYKIEYSTDNSNWTTFVDKMDDGSNKKKTIDYGSFDAKYIRLTAKQSNWGASIYEFEVYGKDLSDFDYKINSVTPSTGSVTVNLTKSTDIADANTVIVATYEQSGLLINMQYQSIDIEKGVASDITIPIDTTNSSEIRVFVWDSLDGLNPLSDIYIVK